MGVACGIVSCGRKSIDLPNGYSLHDNGKISLQAPNGFQPTHEGISQFMVAEPYVYGWIDNRHEEFSLWIPKAENSWCFQIGRVWMSTLRRTPKIGLGAKL